MRVEIGKMEGQIEVQIKQMEREIKEERGKGRVQAAGFETERTEARAQIKQKEHELVRLEEDKRALEKNLKAADEELSNVKNRYK